MERKVKNLNLSNFFCQKILPKVCHGHPPQKKKIVRIVA